MRHYTLPALVGLLFAVGCAGTGTYTYGGSADYYGPDLAYVGPGVQVVAAYDQPVFYSDNYYWRYDNNRWFRSSYYDRGWVYATPPRAVLSIDRPARYRNYRPNGYTPRNRTQVRDHRGYQQQPTARQDRRGYQQAPVRGQVRQAPVHRQAPIRGSVRTAPVQRQAPARQAPTQRQAPARQNQNDDRRRRVRDHRD